MEIRVSLLNLSMSLPLAMLLCGCSSSFVPLPVADDVNPDQTPIGQINGSVHGGQVPVTGAKIYLLAAGTGGYGTASTSLIPTSKNGVNGVSCTGGTNGYCYVTTDGNGNFSVGGDYVCTLGQQVYLVAQGGNSGVTAHFTPSTVSNTAIVQMVGLGQCPASGNMAQQVPFLVVNEVTTVAFAYAMGGFGTDAFHIASAATSQSEAGIANAMTNFGNIVGIAWGGALTASNGNSNSTVPQSKINTLADIIATCVNQSSATSTTCTSLFSLAKNSAGTQPADVATALFNIVQHPATNVTTIYNKYAGNSVFSPLLSTAAPTDWTVPIVYKNVVSSQPGNIAFDSVGNAWISDRGNGAVVMITPAGVVKKLTNLNNGNPNGNIYQVAVDPSDTIWALDYTNSQIYRLDNTGKWLSTITANGTNQMSGPIAISFNSFGSALVLNSGSNYISRFSASGVAQTPATYNQTGADGFGGIGAPEAIAVDGGGNAFIPENVGCGCVGVLVNNSGNELAFNDYSKTVGSASAIAMDASNNAWQAQASSIVEDPTYANGEYQNYSLNFFNFFPTLTGYYFNLRSVFGFPIAVAPSTLTGGGLSSPVALTFDGAGDLWAANSGASTISGFDGTTSLGTTTTGFQTGSSGVTYGVATDPAGNVWTANSDGTVTQILGLATPTATPVYPGQIAKTP